ncbi:hypothetical protein GPECTOR_6g477 [Gonium pectorale]|uniref:CSD domain-containing protein n=1 Tax=Gonium pectorale TaxID=33097 RepID=A0A150GUQ3_GONPE|nr:hypothetical protein GPECTOR_6g477 [Gonium pectorale]|eukprot:KXZ53561.1 hypothetical protein GPECTOR_6g477 [Gonium pectorale]
MHAQLVAPAGMSLVDGVDPATEQGIIAKLHKSFGFIACPHRPVDIFFHVSSLEDCTAEQLEAGTAVSFVAERPADGGKEVARRVRLAPVGTRVRMTQLEPGLRIGMVTDPAAGAARGVIRFLDESGAPSHLLYDGASVMVPPSGAPHELSHTDAPPPPPSQQQGAAPPLPPTAPLLRGQLVLFRIATDMRAAQRARGVVARGGAAPKRTAYQSAAEVRPVAAAALAEQPAALQRQATLLEVLDCAMQASAYTVTYFCTLVSEVVCPETIRKAPVQVQSRSLWSLWGRVYRPDRANLDLSRAEKLIYIKGNRDTAVKSADEEIVMTLL